MINAYGDDLQTILLKRGESGTFDVSVDGKNVYSKAQTKRHAEPGEVVDKIKSMQS